MVDSHPDIAIPQESWFVTELAACRRNYEAPHGFDVECFATDLVAHERFARWGVGENELRGALRDCAPTDFPGAVRAVFSHWATRQGKQRYGDKTPGYLTEITLLAALFPEARFVHLIRDGRDVAMSYSDEFGLPATNAIRRWRAQVRDAREAGHALGDDRYHEIRYETLVADPGSTLREICCFIELPFSDRMLRHRDRAEQLLADMPDRHRHRHVKSPVTVGLRDWRSEMPPHVASACRLLAGDLLDDLGYEPGPAGFSLRGQALAGKLHLERGARLVRAALAEQIGARRPRRTTTQAARGSSGSTRSDPPWPNPLQPQQRSAPKSEQLLTEQVAYYRARAPVYDDWWESRGSDPRSPELREAWLAERALLEADLEEWCAGMAGAVVLELAAGTGNMTSIAARHAARLTAVDASLETLGINAEKLGADAERVEYVVADLFSWEPPRTYDAVLFGFWISHVPADRWDAFWSLVRRCLRPGGQIWFCDSADPELGYRAGVLPRPEPVYRSGDGNIDRQTGIAERAVSDGRSFRVIKRFYKPDDLARQLAAYGIEATVTTTPWAFLLGRGRT